MVGRSPEMFVPGRLPPRFSWLAASGARVEAMYAPELTGRSAAATIEIAPRQR